MWLSGAIKLALPSQAAAVEPLLRRRFLLSEEQKML